MAITDREPVSVSDAELEDLVRLDAPADAATPTFSGPGRVLLATLAAAAGVIHLVMVPSHAGEWLPEGIAFAAAGWLQIALAIILVTKPSRVALRVSCLANIVFIGAWVVSRVWGLPVGPEAFVPHAASFVDITCVVLEALLVMVGYELLVKPEMGAKLGDGARVALSVIPVGVLVLATAAIASPSAINHAHGGGDNVAAAGHDHGNSGDSNANAGAAAAPADDHNHGDAAAATPVDDKGLSKIMNGKGEGGGHTHNNTVVPVDAATQAKLDAQLAQTKIFIEKYPTVKDAEAAGYHRQGPFSPGLGTHYAAPGPPNVSVDKTMNDDALAHPTLIYDGVEPDSKLAGFMYLIFSMDTQNPPEGFAGPNDHWHYHTNVCISMRSDGGIDAPLGADTEATQAQCDKYKGRLIANTGYMVHVWTVPGYESPQGLFSNLNAKITCPNGTYYIIDVDEIGTRKNVCKDVDF
jgi:hypothetical protein